MKKVKDYRIRRASDLVQFSINEQEVFMDNQLKIAVLIDAENISKKYVKLIMDEASAHGVVTYKRVYGDFTTPSVISWQNSLKDHAITPIFQFSYTQGKNASDSALIIDAMDILYSGKVNGFCLVTSDSDFTKLAIRLRESGMLVIGMGEKKTPNSLVSACETFKYLDLLYQEELREDQEEGKTQKKHTVKDTESLQNNTTELTDGAESVSNIPSETEIVSEIKSIIDTISDNDEWIYLSAVGDAIQKRVPGFDPRHYKCRKLRDFVKKFDCFELKQVRDKHSELINVIYIKNKD